MEDKLLKKRNDRIYGWTSGYGIMTMYFPTQHTTFYWRAIP
jgi:hypothetical protein